MPVIDKLLMVGLAALALALAGPAHAATRRAAPPDRVVSALLEQDSALRESAEHYMAISQLSMLYYLCPSEYKVDEGKQAFVNETFDSMSRRYLNQFMESHKARSGKMPGNDVISDFQQRMASQQATAKNHLRQQVESNGCRNFKLVQMEDRWMLARSQRQQANAMKAAAAAESADAAIPAAEVTPTPTEAEPTTKN